MPAATRTQVPIVPAAVQLLQGPVHAMLQQTPSWQKPLEHSPDAVHGTPSGRGRDVPRSGLTPASAPAVSPPASNLKVPEPPPWSRGRDRHPTAIHPIVANTAARPVTLP
jgi:hypothetical protein